MLSIPSSLAHLPYRAACYPGSPLAEDLSAGANCQVFAYALLRAHGFELPRLRSSELWEDRAHTEVVTDPRALDLVLVHHRRQAFGAHVGVFVSATHVAHLARALDRPAIEPLDALLERYRYLIGIKRPRPATTES